MVKSDGIPPGTDGQISIRHVFYFSRHVKIGPGVTQRNTLTHINACISAKWHDYCLRNTDIRRLGNTGLECCE